MPTTIDNRAVKMDFDNTKFETGVSQSLKSIDSLKKGLNFEGAAKGLERIDAQANRVNFGVMSDGIERISSKFSILGIVGFTAIQNITNSLIELSKKAFEAFIGLDAIRTGFGSYETKVNAIRTVMSATGESLDEVVKSINELNEYSDRTVYSFQDMTENISKFTNAGLSSKEAAIAIQGISNVAAESGANTNEAARAMYNFGQALSQGSVRLLDWKSIENANMATIGFKTQLLETAAALGTVKSNLDGTYTTIKDKTVISATKGFNDSLQEQWLSTDVLIKTLTDYASLETEIGKKANLAATQLKTLTQLMDNMADALKTGWTKSFELVIGDLDEATALFTYIGDILDRTLYASARSRNEILQTWHDLGGRTVLLDSLKEAVGEIEKAITPVVEAFREIFPPLTAKRLVELTNSFADFVKKFKIGADTAEKIKTVFKGVFSFLDIGRMLFVSLAKAVFGLSGSLKPVVSNLGDFIVKIADYIINLRNVIKETDAFGKAIQSGLAFIKAGFDYLKPFLERVRGFFYEILNLVKSVGDIDTSGISTFLDGLAKKFQPLTTLRNILAKFLLFMSILIAKTGPIFIRLGTILGDGILAFLDFITDALNNFDPSAFIEFLNAGLFAGILLAIRNFIKNGTSTFNGLGDILNGVRDSLKTWQDNLKADTLLKIAGAIGILAVSLLLIASIDQKRLLGALGAITTLFVELFGAMKSFQTVAPNIKSLAVISAGLLAISAALLIISLAVFTLGKLNTDQLVRATLTIGVLLSLMMSAAKQISTVDKGSLSSAALGITIFAVGLLIISKAVEKLGKLDGKVLAQGLLAIAALLTEIAVFLKVAGNAESMIASATGIVILAGALLVLSAAIAILGGMPIQKVMQGLLAIALALGIIAAAMYMMPPDMLLTSATLLVVAGALVILGAALKILATLSWDEITRSLAVLAGALVILGVAMSAMQGLIGGAATIAIVSGSLVLLAIALQMLGKMSLEEIGLSLLAIAGVLTVLGVAASVLTPAIPSLLGLAAALLLIGVAALATGAGILALGVGLTILAAAGAAGASALVLIITSIISLLPIIAKQVGKAIVSLVTTLAKATPELLDAIIKLLTMLIDAIIDITPKLMVALSILIEKLVGLLLINVPLLVDAGLKLIIAILEGFASNIGGIVKAGYDVVINLIKALSEKIPELAQTGFDMMVTFIDSMADSAEENIPRIMVAVERLGISIVKGILNGIFSARSELNNAMVDIANSLIRQFAETIGAHSPATVFIEQSGYMVSGLVVGMNKFGGRAVTAAGKLAKDATGSFSDAISRMNDTLNDNINVTPSVQPVMDLSKVISGAEEMKGIISETPLTADVSLGTARSVASSIKQGAETSITEQAQPIDQSQNLQFVQNNYSPKALSPTDIYRQTKKQLFQSKGTVGAG